MSSKWPLTKGVIYSNNYIVMQKLLPKTSRNPKGFTLIELLVVITIIAILAVIGLAIFTGVQARARNAKRRADVQAIVGAYEANKATNTSVYPSIVPGHFSGGAFPQDPNGSGAATPQYVVIYVTTGTGYVVNVPTVWAANAQQPTAPATNPAGGAVVMANVNSVATEVPAAATVFYSFAVCTQLEPEVIGSSTRTIFCRHSSQ